MTGFVPFERWRRLNVTVRDSIGASALLVVSLVPGMDGSGADLPEFPEQPLDAFGALLLLGLCAPLALRRRLPVVCALATGIAFVLYQGLAYPITAASLGFPFALYGLGAYQNRGRRELAVLLSVGFLIFALVLHELGSTQNALQYLEFYLVLAGVWVAGRWMREQRAAAERRRQDSVTLALATERALIARELHDVVTHHVTAMVLQADAARMLAPVHPDRASENMAAVSGTGRQALTELRHLLHVLNASAAEREPAGGQVEDVVERARSVGQPVRLEVNGSPETGSGAVDLAVYRVVQESLTNAVKHAQGCPTRVVVSYAEAGVAVEVVTEKSARADDEVRAGHGLAGMSERATVLGGDFEAGPDPEGGFRVRAFLPRAGVPA
ncbi:histidine kinase [Kineosporia rhizophila]|uniref:sensor histidine kinase n=1 Tax=Kineosporia TaxID=49184 RepID=UPI001E341BF6|nr:MULTISPECIES: histidine kinase [Kineosporia]MCE0536378.1 histidine kinase [Kineosporia rhizophila]